MTEEKPLNQLLKDSHAEGIQRQEAIYFDDPDYDWTERAYLRLINARLGRANRFLRNIRNAAYAIAAFLALITLKLYLLG